MGFDNEQDRRLVAAAMTTAADQAIAASTTVEALRALTKWTQGTIDLLATYEALGMKREDSVSVFGGHASGILYKFAMGELDELLENNE